MNIKMIKAFTLAEIMIVLSVIAIITAILLPAARNAMPNDKVMKFKKAHNALHSAISELVNSDKYYLDGDLRVKIDGHQIDGSLESDYTYHCETLYDILNVKEKNCKKDTQLADNCLFIQATTYEMPILKANADYCCANYFDTGSVIKLNNNIEIYQTDNYTPYAAMWKQIIDGFDSVYKLFCIDIDGINQGEDPFGYGIRADGKILNGARADEWLTKSIQDKD